MSGAETEARRGRRGAANGADGSPERAFYCVADERYFLGAVAMVNSLRLVGHTEPVHVLDCGLRAEQRELLAAEASLEKAPGGRLPWLRKTVAPLRRPAEAMVLIDADMVATRRLDELFERAGEGRMVAFGAGYERFFSEWGDLLDLGPARRRAYVSSALVAVGGDAGREVLELMDAAQRRVEPRLGEVGRFFQTLDQDVLNAVLSTRVDPEAVETLPARLTPAPPFEGLQLGDARRLRCAYGDGSEPFALHYLETRRPWNNLPSRKPWIEPAYHGLYSRLLSRLLTGEDVAIRVPEADVPSWLRRGALPRLERAGVNARERLGWLVRERLPGPVLQRLDARRYRRLTAGR